MALCTVLSDATQNNKPQSTIKAQQSRTNNELQDELLALPAAFL
jgi:hypothetical protein